MSSDSSQASKSKVKQTTLPMKKLSQSSEDSDDKRTDHSSRSRASHKSTRSIPQSKITVLEQLRSRSDQRSTPEGTFRNEMQRGATLTATTHNSTSATVITAVLRDLQDDIVHSHDYLQPGPVALMNGERAIAVIGGDRVYVQSKTKFIPMPRDKVLASSDHPQHHFWASQTSRLEDHSPLDVAVMVQAVFTPLSSICFGLLGGVALLHLILVDHLIGGVTEEDQTFFLQAYSRFADLTPLLFYILLAVCIVSALDRVSLRREALSCQPCWIIMAVYCLTLVLTLGCAPYDDLLSLYSHNKTLFLDTMKTQDLVTNWQLLNTLRCLGAMVGWLLCSWTSPPDLLLQHLTNIKQFQQTKVPEISVIQNSLP